MPLLLHMNIRHNLITAFLKDWSSWYLIMVLSRFIAPQESEPDVKDIVISQGTCLLFISIHLLFTLYVCYHWFTSYYPLILLLSTCAEEDIGFRKLKSCHIFVPANSMNSIQFLCSFFCVKICQIARYSLKLLDRAHKYCTSGSQSVGLWILVACQSIERSKGSLEGVEREESIYWSGLMRIVDYLWLPMTVPGHFNTLVRCFQGAHYSNMFFTCNGKTGQWRILYSLILFYFIWWLSFSFIFTTNSYLNHGLFSTGLTTGAIPQGPGSRRPHL